jgi:hypothetical protein
VFSFLFLPRGPRPLDPGRHPFPAHHAHHGEAKEAPQKPTQPAPPKPSDPHPCAGVWVAKPPPTRGEAEQNDEGDVRPRFSRAYVACRLRGGGGNRTRVLWCGTRASPSAVRYVFLSPEDLADKSSTGSATVGFPVRPRGRIQRLSSLADAGIRVGNTPGPTLRKVAGC